MDLALKWEYYRGKGIKEGYFQEIPVQDQFFYKVESFSWQLVIF